MSEGPSGREFPGSMALWEARTMRGRKPVGPELTRKLAGSELARQRMGVILETLGGTCRVQEACEQLGICQQRFDRLRVKAIEAGIAALELKPAGRPAKLITPEQAEIARLRERIVELESAVSVATIRAELLAALPRLATVVAKKSQPRSQRKSRVARKSK